ncbi:MAG: molybdenum cofactor guanylyltransferase [Thermodesulfobacteriota bacterium]|nr:molybdenum cofactor guanylyltransferase [Thermodesulfobacteriota bacterium]
MTGIILSGGKNIRMGTNKAFIKVDGERLIDRTVRLFKDIFEEVILVTNSPLEYLDQDVKIVTDIIKGKSAMGGIYTGLFYSTCDCSFVSACDMPFLNRNFIEYIIANVGHHDIVVPNPPDGLQPLHAIYSSKCLPHIKNSIDMDKLRITGFFNRLKVLKIPADTITTFDPERKMFSNINTKEDLKLIS